MIGGCFIIVLPALYKIVTSWFLHVITCYYMLLHVITCYMLLHVITCYYMLLHIITCYYMLLHVITCYYIFLPVVKYYSHWWTCTENMMDISFHTVCICMLCHSKGSSFGQEGLDTMIRWIVRYATMPFIRTSVASISRNLQSVPWGSFPIICVWKLYTI